MKRILFLALLFCGSGALQLEAQERIREDEIIHTPCDVPPRFKGGITALNQYLNKKLVYPDSAKAAEIEGRVMVSFILDKRGKVLAAQVIKPLGYGCDQEALRLVKKMPRWKPARTKGKRVAVQVVMPVFFILYPNLVYP